MVQAGTLALETAKALDGLAVESGPFPGRLPVHAPHIENRSHVLNAGNIGKLSFELREHTLYSGDSLAVQFEEIEHLRRDDVPSPGAERVLIGNREVGLRELFVGGELPVDASGRVRRVMGEKDVMPLPRHRWSESDRARWC